MFKRQEQYIDYGVSVLLRLCSAPRFQKGHPKKTNLPWPVLCTYAYEMGVLRRAAKILVSVLAQRVALTGSTQDSLWAWVQVCSRVTKIKGTQPVPASMSMFLDQLRAAASRDPSIAHVHTAVREWAKLLHVDPSTPWLVPRLDFTRLLGGKPEAVAEGVHPLQEPEPEPEPEGSEEEGDTVAAMLTATEALVNRGRTVIDSVIFSGGGEGEEEDSSVMSDSELSEEVELGQSTAPVEGVLEPTKQPAKQPEKDDEQPMGKPEAKPSTREYDPTREPMCGTPWLLAQELEKNPSEVYKGN